MTEAQAGIWIDTDMGFDDIAAIMVAQRFGPGVDGVSLVFGNAELAQVCRNAAGAASAFGWQFPTHIGRASPILSPLETATNVLGKTGIPTAGRSLPPSPRRFPLDAFDALCAWLAQGSPKLKRRILALGPLTNIAAVILARPELISRIDEVVWMGGGLTTGNHTASAEFNACADPEAVAIVIAHGLPLRMVDLDLCRQVLCWPQDVAAIRAGKGAQAQLIGDLLAGFVEIATSRGRPAMALYDAVAATCLVAPEIVTWRPARIDMELTGRLTRGRTVVEGRAGRAEFNATYAAAIDAEEARGIILSTLQSEADR